MKTCDHSLLGKYILRHTDNVGVLRHKTAFLIGCVEPDYNYITYLRGSISHKNLLGHHTQNSTAHIKKIINKLMKEEIYSTYDCFVLGTLVHYISDSFTLSHTTKFSKPFSYHGRYEKKLHMVIEKFFMKDIVYSNTRFLNPLQLWTDCQESYLNSEPSFFRDVQYILLSCLSIVNMLGTKNIANNLDVVIC